MGWLAHNGENAETRMFSLSKKKEYCSILDKCDDIAANITKVDISLTKSHQTFSSYRKIILLTYSYENIPSHRYKR